MSTLSTPRSGMGEPKQMSSRLLTMKFMQRAVAASSQKDKSSPSTPNSEPPSKKRKFDDSPSNSIPSTPPQPLTDLSFASAALKAEAEAQATARARNARPGDETEWVLNLNLPTTNTTSEATESDTDEVWSNHGNGRQTYGSFKKKKTQATATSSPPNDDLSSLSDSDSSSPPAGSLRELSSKADKKRRNQKAYEHNLDTMDLARAVRSTPNGLGARRKMHNDHDQADSRGNDRGKVFKKDRKKFRKTM